MKKILILISFLIFGLFGCDSAEWDQENKTDQLLKEVNSQIGLPAIKNFQEKKLAKMIFELRDQENLVTYVYLQNLNGSLVFIGKAIGFGLPYSVQYTNPQQSGGRPQADPNGLYMPQGLSATWVMMIDPHTGKGRPVYIEPNVIISPFPLN